MNTYLPFEIIPAALIESVEYGDLTAPNFPARWVEKELFFVVLGNKMTDDDRRHWQNSGIDRRDRMLSSSAIAHVLLSVSIVFLFVAQVSAEPDSAAIRLKVKRLERQLSAPLAAERQAAEDELIKLGPSILPLLPPVDAPMDAETRMRLTRIRRALQTVQSADPVDAVNVSLDLNNVLLSEAFKQLARVSGAQFVYDPPADQPEATITYQCDNLPFWQAVDGLLDRAELTLASYEIGGQPVVVPRDESMEPRAASASYVGPFRIAPIRVTASLDTDQARSGLLRVETEISWPPSAAPIFLKQRMASIEGMDDRGEKITASDPAGVYEISTDGRSSRTAITLLLKRPERAAKELTQLAGTLESAFPGRVETFRFDDLTAVASTSSNAPIAGDAGPRLRIADVTVTVERVRRLDDGLEIRVAARFDNSGAALESYRGWMFRNEASLVTADDEKLQPTDTTVYRQTPEEIGVSYRFKTGEALERLRLEYRSPASIVMRDYRWQLKSIELP